jgi:DNA-binding transcriptional MocR family regulator
MFTDYHTSQLLQAAVLEFCERGHYKDHLRNLARVNGKKSQLLVKAMVDYFPEGVSWTEPEGGYAFWVTLPRHLSSEILLAEAARAGVLFSPGSQFFTNGEGQQFLRLSISRVPTDRIEEGARRLGKLIERYITKEPQRSPQSAGEPVFHI